MLANEYVKTRDALIELIHHIRVLAKHTSTDLKDDEIDLVQTLQRPYRIAVIGDPNSGKTSLIKSLFDVDYNDLKVESPAISIIRDAGYRVFSDVESNCEKHYVTGIKEIEIIEVSDFVNLDESQHATLVQLLANVDFLFWIFSADNPWSPSTWDAVEKIYPIVEARAALVLQKTDIRSSDDCAMLLKHMDVLCKKRLQVSLPQFALNSHDRTALNVCLSHLNDILNYSSERRSELRSVYTSTYSLLHRIEQNIDDLSRELAGNQEYLQSIEAQIDRLREQEVLHAASNMNQLSTLLDTQIKRVMRYTSLRSGMIATHLAIFGKGDTASKIEKFLINNVSEQAEKYAQSEVKKMAHTCQEKWLEMKPHLEKRLSIEVSEFNQESFDEQGEIFCDGFVKSVRQSLLQLKLRRFYEMLVYHRFVFITKLVKMALLLLTIGSLVGLVTKQLLGVVTLITIGVAVVLIVFSMMYSRRTGTSVNRNFAESLKDSVPAFRKSLSDSYLDRVRYYYNGFTPLFESMRRHISTEKTNLLPKQKIAAQLFLRLKALEQEI